MSVIKCTQCNKPVDRENEAHVVIPNIHRVGYRRHHPTKFAHASCFETLVIHNHEVRLRDEARTAAMVEEAMRKITAQAEKTDELQA